MTAFKVLGLALATVMISSCNYTVKKPSGDGGGSGADSANKAGAIDFEMVKAGVLRAKCISCHRHADMEDYNSAMDSVVPGRPDESALWYKLINAGGNMPKGGSALTDEEASLIRQWILNGAPEKLPTEASGEPAAPAPAPEPEPEPAPAPAPVPAPQPVPPDESNNELVNPTFTDLEAKVFAKKCLMCHSTDDAADGVSLQTYDEIINNKRLVVPGNSAASGLYVAVSEKNPPYMPPARAVARGVVQPLTEQEKQALKAWIDGGAVRN